MPAYPMPSAISVIDAIKMIAGCTPNRHAGATGGLSKEQIVTLARVACRTEGIKWERIYGHNITPSTKHPASAGQ